MPITLNCPKCHKPFRVRDESIGGRVRCPSCGSVLQVPAALSPASNFDEAPKSDAGDTVRPVAEEVQGRSHAGSMHDVAVAGSREGTVDLGPPPGAPLPGPPSIRAQMPTSPPVTLPRQTDRPSVPVSLPTAPSPDRARQPSATLRPLSDGEATWAKVGGGLRMIRMAMFLIALLFLALFGHAVWIMFDFERAWSDDPGLLKKADWPLKKEVFAAYTAGLCVPAALLLLIGRLRCGAAPAESHARSLALGAAFFTLLAFAGIGLFIALTYFHLGDKVELPPQTRLTAIYAAVPSALLADVLTLLFIGQIGWPLRCPRLQKSVAGLFVYAGVLAGGVLIGMEFYPVVGPILRSLQETGSPLGFEGDDLAKRAMIWGVILLTACVMFFLRYAGVAGQGRRAIRRLIAGDA